MVSLDYQDSDTRMKKEEDSSSRVTSLELLMDDSRLLVVEEYEFQNLDVIINIISGISGLSRIGSNEKT